MLQGYDTSPTSCPSYTFTNTATDTTTSTQRQFSNSYQRDITISVLLQGYDTSPSSCPSYTFINTATEPRLALTTAFPAVAGNPDLVDLCCIQNNSTDPCLVANGGIYLAGVLVHCCAALRCAVLCCAVLSCATLKPHH